MLNYVTLYKWTAQGIKEVKDTVGRVEKATQLVEKLGGKLLSVYWTQGRYDLVAISEWPDEESATAFTLALASTGNVQSETMRAFSAEAMTRILDKMP